MWCILISLWIGGPPRASASGAQANSHSSPANIFCNPKWLKIPPARPVKRPCPWAIHVIPTFLGQGSLNPLTRHMNEQSCAADLSGDRWTVKIGLLNLRQCTVRRARPGTDGMETIQTPVHASAQFYRRQTHHGQQRLSSFVCFKGSTRLALHYLRICRDVGCNP